MSPLLFRRLSDESLGSRLASGEAAAFDELYRRYVHRLAAYGAHLLGDAAAGDDVAQAALLKAYTALRDGRVPDKMRPWLFRIAHNAAIDLVVRRRELPSDNLPETPSRDPEPVAGALVAALAALPQRQREVYVLRELHGMRIDETATELGLNSTQVEQALFAARNRLAELLVFGDRLDCVTVQRLAAGPLDADERRALKTHLRSCRGCRSTVSVRARIAGSVPASSLDWLRGLLLGGAAPAAAKVGAVVATATIAAGVPVAVGKTTHDHAEHHKAPSRPAVVHVSVLPHAGARPVARVTSQPLPVTRHTERHDTAVVEQSRHDGGSSSGDSSRDAVSTRGDDGGSTSIDSSGNAVPTRSGADGGGGDRPATVDHSGSGSGGDGGSATTAPAPTTVESGDGRDGSSGGGSSGPGDESDGGSTPTTTTVPTTTVEAPTTTIDGTTTTSSDGGGSSGHDGR